MKPEEMVDATFRVQAVRDLRTAVVEPIGPDLWRKLVRETYPTSLDKVGPEWLKRWGHEVDWNAVRKAQLLRLFMQQAVSDQRIHETVRKVCVIRPGVEPQTARAVIEALLVVGWTPPAQG